MDDTIQALTCIFAQRTDGMIDAASLAGSFNPSVARQLLVGQN